MKELEEFINTIDTPPNFDQFSFDEGIRIGANWQSKRNYSEKEVLELLINFNKHTRNIRLFKLGNSFDVRDWFKQFKKKI